MSNYPAKDIFLIFCMDRHKDAGRKQSKLFLIYRPRVYRNDTLSLVAWLLVGVSGWKP